MTALALMYHDVVDDGAWDASGFPGPAPATFKLTRDDFENHLAVVSAVARGRPTVFDLRPERREPVVLLTFDDGGVSAQGCIAELLERFGWRGHFFVTTDRIGTPGFMSAPQVRELAARGHIVGTHSCSHPRRMSSLSQAQLLHEWRRSAALLSDIVGAPITTASVPGGFYSRPVAAAAAAAGIRALFTSEPTTRCHRVDGCLVIGRYSIRRSTAASTAARIAAGSIVPRWWQWTFWNVKKVAKLVGGDAYLALRQLVYGAGAARRLPHGGAHPAKGQQPGV